MRKTAFYAFALLLCCLSCRGQQPSAAVQVAPSAPVKPGIEVLRERGFEGLKGKRVGLLTNPSGVDRNLKSTVDILFEAPEVNLVALFAPEHGVRGDVYAGGKVESGRDETTGLPVHSVYGATRKPTPEMLRGLDIVVYDIQDVGTRSYTFISSLGLMMSACAELGIEVMVLDRPNPLGGRKVEGSLVEPGFYSFVSQYPIPYIYGLTAGEVATFINEEGVNLGQKGTDPFHKCKLTVVPMEGWRRDMRFTDTGLPWILPSPNIPYPQTAIDYPCSGLVGECPGFLNIGIGYSLPFELFAAPWIDADKLKARLDSYKLPGIAFRTIHYTPFSGSMRGTLIHGVQFYFTDYEVATITLTQFWVMQAIHELYPDRDPFATGDYAMFDKCAGSDYIRTTFRRRYKVADILDFWNRDADGFRALSSKYYLYE
ncbi:MAG: DUF1343 domain-containing protein [Bacteroidales bacterium]|nr:DUF1343 domain-containing protein [Bacteroidales bacterium]